MATKQIRIGEDCIAILDQWRHEHESMSDAVRRMRREIDKLKKAGAMQANDLFEERQTVIALKMEVCRLRKCGEKGGE